MKTFWQKIFSLPVVLGTLAVFIVVFLASSNLVLPSPTRVFQKMIGRPMGTGVSQGGDLTTLEKRVAPDVVSMPPVPPFWDNEDFTSLKRYVVRTANLSLEVEEVSQAVEESAKYVESIGGLVTNSSLTKTDDGYIGYLTVRVPEKEFSAALNYLKRLAKSVKEEQVSAYDETGLVTNAEEQMDSLEIQAQEYRSLLNQAQTTEEKLRIQQQLNRIGQQIEALDRQVENLGNQAAMSSISVTFTEEKFTLPLLGDLGLGDTVKEATKALKRVVVSLVILAVWVVIFTPVWLPIVLVVRWLKKKK